MEFKQLESFAAVIKCNSFTKAAEKLYISQPTISTHIRALEEELNTRLILRTTKSIEVTPEGRKLYDYAENILQLRNRMLEECTGGVKKILHLAASTIPSAYILPEVLPAYGATRPDHLTPLLKLKKCRLTEVTTLLISHIISRCSLMCSQATQIRPALLKVLHPFLKNVFFTAQRVM